jgi:sigma-B regulation protein RsbU (phosphoserine phosphatase)
VQSLAPRHGLAVDALAEELNRSLGAAVESHRYATLFYGVFDDPSRELVWVNAGHPAPIVVRPGASPSIDTLATSGTVIGLLPTGSWRAHRRVLAPGDVLCAVTDGVTEATEPGGVEFGTARLAALLARSAGEPAESVCAEVLDEVERFTQGARPTDDRTVVVARAR